MLNCDQVNPFAQKRWNHYCYFPSFFDTETHRKMKIFIVRDKDRIYICLSCLMYNMVAKGTPKKETWPNLAPLGCRASATHKDGVGLHNVNKRDLQAGHFYLFTVNIFFSVALPFISLTDDSLVQEIANCAARCTLGPEQISHRNQHGWVITYPVKDAMKLLIHS